MAPTLSHTHAGVAVTAILDTANTNKHVTPQHSHSRSITHTKGLLNAPGQNNCFLNSAVQVLWHLDIFRRSFRELSGHACMADSCIFCALKELFAQFQYSHESALPPDALRRALAETFFNQQRFQLGFMDDAAECFENILLRIHFHITNNESEDMCNTTHCISHQKFAMTLVEQGVCHACGATSEPLPFTQMVHYVTSSTLCAQAKISRENGDSSFLNDFGKLLRKAGGMGETRECPSTCGAKIQIQRTLMNHPEIISIGIVWDSERPTLDHIMDVFQAIGSTIHIRDVFHTVIDDRWAASAQHQLVGVVTYYGKHYSTFFFHTKLRVWIYFDDATVREIGPRWEQVVEKCRRGHFQPLLLLYANPHGNPVTTESAPKTVVYARASEGPGYRPLERVSVTKNAFVSPLRRAMTPNPEKQHDVHTEVIPRRAITPNPEVHYRQELQNNPNYQQDKVNYCNNGNGIQNGRFSHPSSRYPPQIEQIKYGVNGSTNIKGGHQEAVNSIYNMELLQNLLHNKCGTLGTTQNGHNNIMGSMRTNGYFNNCDVIDGKKVNPSISSNPQALRRPVQNGDILNNPATQRLTNDENIYISRKAVENVLNYQKLQRHRSNSENNDSVAGSRNSNSSLESFENALRMRSHYNVKNVLENQRADIVDAIDVVGSMNNVPRCRDSGNWSGDRNSASSTSSNSVETPYFQTMTGNINKRMINGLLGSPIKGSGTYDAGYDSFSLSSNDSFPTSHIKQHNQHLAKILENPNKQTVNAMNGAPPRLIKNQPEFVDECHILCLEADKFLEKSLENEKTGDLDGAISLCNSAAAKARAAMDAPYSNPQILMFARMKHNTCVMRARTLHRRLLVRKDSISSHGSSTGTDIDSPLKPDGSNSTVLGHHSRQSSRDSTRSKNGNHSRQSSRDGNHSRQGSKDSTLNGISSSKDASSSDKKRIELYGTLPKRNSTKKIEKTNDLTTNFMNRSMTNAVSSMDVGISSISKAKPVPIPIVRDTRIPRRISFRSSSSAECKHQDQPNNQIKQESTTFNHLDPSLKNQRSSTSTIDLDVAHRTTLHRTNSIPANFISKTENSANMDAILPAPIKQVDIKVGKKQHKIRRKLLLGGLIRRKNRSMPDLREGQDTSPSLESRSFDDSGLPRSQLPLPSAMMDSKRNTSNLSCQDIYTSQNQNHLHHYSSHGKIPPTPPVRTTSQLTSRSQSHSSLFNTQERRKTAFGFPCPVVPTTSNEVTIHADVHHERTPSDNIKPVSLERTMSMRGLPSNPNQHQHHQSSQLQLSQHNATMNVSSKINQPEVIDDSRNTSGVTKTSDSGGSGLLDQLLSKRQQMLNNPLKNVQESQGIKPALPKSESWLQELQAKQQKMLGKKPIGLPTTKTKATSIGYCGEPNIDQISKITHSFTHKTNGQEQKPTAATPSLISAEGHYQPKSVRDLANKFEQIIVNPAPESTTSSQDSLASRNNRNEEVGLPSVPPMQLLQQRYLPSNQIPIGTEVGLPIKSMSTTAIPHNNINGYIAGQTNIPSMALTNIIPKAQQLNESAIRPNGSIPSPYPGSYTHLQIKPKVARNNIVQTVTDNVLIRKPSPGQLPMTIVERPAQQKKGKKSVTFSDQIVLVACAEDNGGFSLLNPLLQKVLQKSNGIKPQDNKQTPNATNCYRPATNGNTESVVYQQTSVQNHYTYTDLQSTPKTSIEIQSPSPQQYSGLPMGSSMVTSTQNQIQNCNASIAMASTPEVPCYLCRKTSVVPPVIYCVDCEFYMSRFKPKN